MNLYQTNQLAKLESHIDHETGEIDIDGFNQSQIALQDKQLAVVAYLKNETVRIDMLESAIKDLKARKDAMQSRHDGLKNYLLVNMQANGISEITASDLTFSAKIKKNPPKLVIQDATLIPREYFVQPPAPPPTIDNARLKDDLKNGIEVLGAVIEQAERVDIK